MSNHTHPAKSEAVTTHWEAEVAPVGHFTVLRALPTAPVQAIGPFVFLDHFGPAKASPETLPAHPHAGIEVMTYLLEGANEHRDSMGHHGVVEAGGAQWMRAGTGILHAETNLPERAPNIHGLQIWARLPLEHQDNAPAYRAIQASEVVRWTNGDATYKLLCGRYSGADEAGHNSAGPIPLAAPAILLHIHLAAGARCTVQLDETDFEYGLYGIAGSIVLEEGAPTMKRGTFAQLTLELHTVNLHNTSGEAADILLLGGQPAPRPLHFGGPFVYESRAQLMAAQERYFSGRMGQLDGVPG